MVGGGGKGGEGGEGRGKGEETRRLPTSLKSSSVESIAYGS